MVRKNRGGKRNGSDFTKQLLFWHLTENERKMPWKGEKDPYKIWLSEIILQQTRVEQGTAYFEKFTKRFPTVQALANAPETIVFKLWEGLGYYSRCKNLIATAKQITNELNGKFPDNYPGLLGLKGIGPYTAAAIASFAYNAPHAVVDGNVFRVLSRVFGIETPIDTTEGKKIFSDLALRLLDKLQPALYNQAIMDFGATVCKPRSPECSTCIFQGQCSAYQNGQVNILPVKAKALAKTTRWMNYLVIEYADSILLRKRAPGDIWENLYEPVLMEGEWLMKNGRLADPEQLQSLLGKLKYELISVSSLKRQTLSHRVIQGYFIRLRIKKPLALNGYERVTEKKAKALPFPKFIGDYLKE